jgi:hypothetical protein
MARLPPLLPRGVQRLPGARLLASLLDGRWRRYAFQAARGEDGHVIATDFDVVKVVGRHLGRMIARR